MYIEVHRCGPFKSIYLLVALLSLCVQCGTERDSRAIVVRPCSETEEGCTSSSFRLWMSTGSMRGRISASAVALFRLQDALPTAANDNGGGGGGLCGGSSSSLNLVGRAVQTTELGRLANRCSQ